MKPLVKPVESGTGASFADVIGRLAWIFVGPLTLMLLLMTFATHPRDWFSGMTFIYFAVLLIMIWGRWREHRAGSPKTVYGDPAKPEHFRQYLLVIVPLALAAWVLANVVGHRKEGQTTTPQKVTTSFLVRAHTTLHRHH